LFYVALITGLVLAISSSAHAEDLSVTTTESVDPHPSGVVSRLPLKDAFLDGEGLGERLDAATGVTVRSQAGLGQPAHALIRGGNPRQNAVSIEGARLNVPFGIGFDLGGLLFPGIESVEIYRGAAGVAQGSGALTGALDLRVSDVRQEGWAVNAGTMAGSFQTLGAESNARLSTGSTHLSVGVQARQSEGDYNFVDAQGQAHQRVNNDHRGLGALVSIRQDVSKTSFVQLTAIHSQAERGSAGPAEFQSSFSEARVDESLTLVTAKSTQRNVAAFDSAELDVSEQVDAQIRRIAYDNPTAFQGGGGLQTTGDYVGVSGALHANIYSGKWWGNLDAKVRHDAYQGEEFGELQSSLAQARTSGSIGSGLEWRPVEFLALVSGLRAEVVHGGRDRLGLLPSAGIVIIPDDAIRVRANFARTRRLPDFDELYLNLESLRGNPNLRSERALVWDAGVVVSPGRFNLGLTYFQSHMEDAIYFLPVTSAITEATNLEEFLIQGVELELKVKPWEPLELFTNATFTHAPLSETGAQIPHQPVWSGRTGGRFELSSLLPKGQRLSVEVSGLGRTETNLENFGNVRSPGFITIESGVRYSPTAWMALFARGSNLLNVQGRVDSVQQPLPGRAVFVSARFSAEGS